MDNGLCILWILFFQIENKNIFCFLFILLFSLENKSVYIVHISEWRNLVRKISNFKVPGSNPGVDFKYLIVFKIFSNF